MKHQLDLKSTLVGVLCALLLTVIISFKNSADTSTGKYQTAIGETGVVILDTQTGAYIMAPLVYAKSQWIRGNFESKNIHEIGSKKDQSLR